MCPACLTNPPMIHFIMPTNILVATPQPIFGELLRLSLEESGLYQVRLAQTADQALAIAARIAFCIAILDTDLPGQPFALVVQRIRSLCPGLRWLVIPSDNDIRHAAVAELQPDGYVTRPFYLPDLLETVARLSNQPAPVRAIDLARPRGELSQAAGEPLLSSPQQAAPVETAPELQLESFQLSGLADANAVQAHLEALITSTTVRAALVLAGTSIVVRCGELDKDGAVEIVNMLARSWQEDALSDLMRFVRLRNARAEFLLYAIHLKDNLSLVLMHDPFVSVVRIRSLAQRMGRELMGIAVEPPAEKAPTILPPTAPRSTLVVQTEAAALETNPPLVYKPIQPVPPHGEKFSPAEKHGLGWLELPINSVIRFSGERGIEDANLNLDGEAAALLDAAAAGGLESEESADEQPAITGAGLYEMPALVELEADAEMLEDGDDFPLEAENIRLADLLSGRPATHPEPLLSAQVHPPAEHPTWQNSTPPQQIVQHPTRSQATFLFPWEQVELSPNDCPTQPIVVRPAGVSQVQLPSRAYTPTLAEYVDLDPNSFALSRLCYTSVLIPRMPMHFLTGSLADQLRQWVPKFCLAFGWRLIGLTVRPEFLQWAVQVAPAVSPGNLVRIIRQHTSQQIYASYFLMSQENPSGDFWAPGYLIISGQQPVAMSLIREFILQTRRRQGLTFQ